jgi:hypothetical protein
MTVQSRGGLRCARLVVAASAIAAWPVHAVDADSGVMFQRLRQLRGTEPSVLAAYVLSRLREVSEIAAACGWAASSVIDTTVDRAIVYLDTHLPPHDVTAAQLRRRGVDAIDAVGSRQIAGASPDMANESCAREGRHYRDWVVIGEVAGQPAAPLPTTASLDALVPQTNDAAGARAAYQAGLTLVAIAERADACAVAPFSRIQGFEEAVTRAEESLLLTWGNPAPVAAGFARLLGSERVRADLFETSRLPCADRRVRADWQLWGPLANTTSNLVELALAVGPAFVAKVAATRSAACDPEGVASATSTALDPAPSPTAPPLVFSPAVAAKARHLAESKAFAEAAETHARGAGCPPAPGRR